jgi:hypothetical protein
MNPGIAALAGNTGDDELDAGAAPTVPVPVVAGPAGPTVPAPTATQGVPISTLTAPVSPAPRTGGVSEDMRTQIMRQTNALSAANPQAAAKPGGWARALLGGVSQALAGLGDARDAGSGDAKTTGWLQGVTSTLGNREARISAQNQQATENARKDKELAGVTAEQQARIQRDQVLTAHESAAAMHESKVWSQMDDESKKKLLTQERGELAEDQAGDMPSPILATDVDSDQLMQKIKAGLIDPSAAHRFLTGQRENPDGTSRDLYTVIGQGPAGPQAISDAWAKRYNEAFPDKPPIAAGTASMSWAEKKATEQIISNVETAKALREDNERKLGIEREKEVETTESNALQQDPRFMKFMGASKLNGLAAYQLAAADPQMVKDYPRLVKDFSNAVGKEVWDAQIKEATSNHDAAQKALDKLENDPEAISGEKSSAAIATANARISDPLTPAEERPRWQRILAQATSAQKLTQQAKANEKRSEDAIAEGDPTVAGELLATGVMTPDQVKSNRKPEFVVAANKAALDYTIAHGMPHYDAGQQEGYYTTAKSPGNIQFFTNANSLTDKGGTLEQLAAQSAQLPAGSIPKFNSWEQFTKQQFGDPRLRAFQTTALGVGDDFSQVMGGGGTDSARGQVLQLIDPALSPAQKAGVIAAIRASVDSKAAARIGSNPYMRKMYAGNAPAPNPGIYPQNKPTPTLTPQTQPVGHKVGDTIVQNGLNFKVTSVDANGKVTGAAKVGTN